MLVDRTDESQLLFISICGFAYKTGMSIETVKHIERITLVWHIRTRLVDSAVCFFCWMESAKNRLLSLSVPERHIFEYNKLRYGSVKRRFSLIPLLLILV